MSILRTTSSGSSSPISANTTTYYQYNLNGGLTKMFDTSRNKSTYFEYGPQQLVTKVTPPVADGNP